MTLTLFDGEVGKNYLIKSVLGDDQRKRRLLDMGFTPKSQIRIIAVAPLKKTVLVNLRGILVALRNDATKLIELEWSDGI